MPARRYIIALSLLALLLALIIPPPDLPNTPYNESDSPFVALQAASPHLDSSPAQQSVIVPYFSASPYKFKADSACRFISKPVPVISLPIMLHVLLC